MQNNESIDKSKDDEFAIRLGLYSSMAHFVGKTLHIRPNEILDTWGVPELIVAFGYFSNEISLQNYEQWQEMDAKDRAKHSELGRKYNVKFIGLDKADGREN